ncbi:MAG TPA: glycosyltransferase, partial [Nitriliruptorales bacterium]|nr:glycosyltransferase [Nitriliruptorales bacterium]
MRILQIAPPWFAVPPESYGGIEWVVALLADGLTDAGHEVTLVASGGSRTHARLHIVYETPPSEAIGDLALEVSHVIEGYLQADSIDLVHDHSGLVGPALGALAPVTVVHT